MAFIRKALAIAVLGVFLPAANPSGNECTTRGFSGGIAGYVEDGDYKASFELMDLSPPVSWLTDWMFV